MGVTDYFILKTWINIKTFRKKCSFQSLFLKGSIRKRINKVAIIFCFMLNFFLFFTCRKGSERNLHFCGERIAACIYVERSKCIRNITLAYTPTKSISVTPNLTRHQIWLQFQLGSNKKILSCFVQIYCKIS